MRTKCCFRCTSNVHFFLRSLACWANAFVLFVDAENVACDLQSSGFIFCSFAPFLMVLTESTQDIIHQKLNQRPKGSSVATIVFYIQKDACNCCVKIGFGKVSKYAIKLLALVIFVLLIYLLVCDYLLAISICIVEKLLILYTNDKQETHFLNK